MSEVVQDRVFVRPESSEEFEQYRVELTGYCYRMLGSGFEADDAVQDTMVRAWKNIDQFEGRSSLRSWLYRIATNVCLSMSGSSQRRARPMDFGPASTAETPIGPKRPEVPWLEPVCDAAVLPSNVDPSESVVLRETVRLAFVAALQHLPAKQRAVLILCEVLRWKADEVATLLESTTASVNSALQRARATLSENEIDLDAVSKPTLQQQMVVARYTEAFERYDMDKLVSLLHEDVVMSMPPYDLWLTGPEQVRAWMTGQGHGCEGSRVVFTAANASPSFGQYRPRAGGGHEAWALVVLEVEDDRVTAINSFLDTLHLFPRFGLPLTLEEGQQV